MTNAAKTVLRLVFCSKTLVAALILLNVWLYWTNRNHEQIIRAVKDSNGTPYIEVITHGMGKTVPLTFRTPPKLCVFAIPPSQQVNPPRIELVRCDDARFDKQSGRWQCIIDINHIGPGWMFVPDGAYSQPVDCGSGE